MLYKSDIKLFKPIYIKHGLKPWTRPSNLSLEKIDETYKEYIPLFLLNTSPCFTTVYLVSKKDSTFKFEVYIFWLDNGQRINDIWYGYSKAESDFIKEVGPQTLLNKRVLSWLLRNLETPCKLEVFEREGLVEYIRPMLKNTDLVLSQLLSSRLDENTRQPLSIYKLETKVNIYNHV